MHASSRTFRKEGEKENAKNNHQIPKLKLVFELYIF